MSKITFLTRLYIGYINLEMLINLAQIISYMTTHTYQKLILIETAKSRNAKSIHKQKVGNISDLFGIFSEL